MPDVAKIAEGLQAQGLDVVSTIGGIVVTKLGEKRYLYYQAAEGSLTISDELVLGGFYEPQAIPKRVVLTLTPIGEYSIAIASIARVRTPEDIPALLPILKAVQEGLRGL